MRNPYSARLTHRVASLSAVALVGVAALTGCGSSSSATDAGTTPGQGFRSGGPGGFAADPALQKKIQKCLKAAGLSSSIPSGRPSGFPSGTPSGTPPSGAPSGGFSGRPGAGFGNSEVRAALQACGITLPSRPSGAPSS